MAVVVFLLAKPTLETLMILYEKTQLFKGKQEKFGIQLLKFGLSGNGFIRLRVKAKVSWFAAVGQMLENKNLAGFFSNK